VAADIVTIGLLIGAVSIGKWMDSEALQWIAGICTVVVIVGVSRKFSQ
jgi:hypothetical protein